MRWLWLSFGLLLSGGAQATPGFVTTVLSLTNPGVTPFINLQPTGFSVALPAISCIVPVGATMTYTVQFTGDSVPTYAGNWNNFPTMTNLTASAATGLGIAATGIRFQLLTTTGGTLTCTFTQVTSP
jgi:hypothetical protein